MTTDHSRSQVTAASLRRGVSCPSRETPAALLHVARMTLSLVVALLIIWALLTVVLALEPVA